MKSQLRSLARSAAHAVDAGWCSALLAVRGDPPGLVSFLFHAVAEDGGYDEIDPVVDPTQSLTVEALRGFVRHFKAHGYSFVGPEEILAGLDADGRYVLMTFDDGYFNNLRVRALLEEEEVPATFFISTRYIESGRAFWWDVVHRERSRRGVATHDILQEQVALKRRTHAEIEAYLVDAFGVAALDPVGDEDRPMTVSELREFAASPWVRIGNHTMDHAILTNYPAEEVREQIVGAQDMLAATTGARPLMISYPNGNYSDEVVRVTEECGLQLGVTVDGRRSGPDASSDAVERYRLGRFCFTRGSAGVPTYLGFRAGWSPRTALRRLRQPS